MYYDSNKNFFFSALPLFLLQEISVVKGSGKVEQAKNKRNWETGKIVVKAEIIWKDKKAILLKQKKAAPPKANPMEP